ncbi:hypothetical protein BC826DRAFT_992064 [Russula brevipes]|nr:hypothetical protein BC826DRAFT_992064 [Russula brevipes]
MSGKLDSFSKEQAQGRPQSDCKLPRVRRPPFADITNMHDRLGRHDESPYPPLQLHTLSGTAMQKEGTSEARNCLAESVAPLRDRRAVQPIPPPLASHADFPFPLEGTGISSLIKADSVVPSAPLAGSAPHHNGDSVRSKPSRRQASLGCPLTQNPYEPDLCGDNLGLPSSSCAGTSTREPLSTSLLPPATHKLACGQLAILPSRSVLVDFREGERRKGKKGDEVMVVSPNGDQIHLFSAPHLSTPCCLAEPIATHKLNEVPADRYKLYEQAKKVIEHIKRNVPKIVMYEGTFVCTLMANEPRADIEIRTNPRLTTATISASTTATTRIRFSRRLRTMQIFSSAPSLSKKTMFCTARGIPTEAGDWALLSKNEKECQAALLDFLRTVEAVEGLSRGDGSEPLFAISTERPSEHSAKWEAAQFAPSAIPPPRGEGDAHRQVTSLPIPAAAPALPLPSPSPSTTAPPPFGRSTDVTVSPRPRFPSALPRASSDTFRRASSTAVGDAPPAGGGDPQLGARAEMKMPRSRLQTRFMPGVGWCVRSGGARYRIMFTDGVVLEVDVEEERVEMVERDGSAARYTVRDCSASRKVGDRMKVFREFLPLFDESDP